MSLRSSPRHAPLLCVAARFLFYSPRGSVRFPYNGRTLTDDVVDVFFSMLTKGKVIGDKVGRHSDLLDEFPYLGPPPD